MMNKSLVLEKLRLKILYKIDLLDVSDDDIKTFRKHVKNNKFLDDETIIKKINRNWILAKDTERIKYVEGFKVYIRKYGNLEMRMFPASEYELSDDKIYYIYNRKGKKQDFKIDEKLKEELNKKMKL